MCEEIAGSWNEELMQWHAPVVPGLDPGVTSLIVILVVHALVGEM